MCVGEGEEPRNGNKISNSDSETPSVNVYVWKWRIQEHLIATWWLKE